MSDCCPSNDESKSDAPPTHSASIRCPRCQRMGKAVPVLTIKHQVKPSVAATAALGNFRFCATANCPVVYYDGEGATLLVDDVRQPVTQKTPGNPPLCYCFGYDEAMVQEELRLTGGCTIADRIVAEVRAGNCACEVRNPLGSCCLGNIRAAIGRATAASPSNTDRS